MIKTNEIVRLLIITLLVTVKFISTQVFPHFLSGFDAKCFELHCHTSPRKLTWFTRPVFPHERAGSRDETILVAVCIFVLSTVS